jgi:hypothetical protein
MEQTTSWKENVSFISQEKNHFMEAQGLLSRQ